MPFEGSHRIYSLIPNIEGMHFESHKQKTGW